jgi:serine/threonine protein kinase
MRKKTKYEIIELIYKGMAARSFKARDPILNRLVLLKILHHDLSSDTQWVQRFEREAVIQAKLRHPNIVTIYELGKGDNFYIASEYVQGITLKELIAKKGSVDLETLSPIIVQVIAALRYAHKRGIVHRDLKSANILITEKNEVKLTDFGLAFARDSGTITQEGFVLGTPAYMSPEQARGKKVDFRSDIFSLGVTIYEALSGKNPFEGETYADSISRVLNVTPKTLAEVVPNLPENVSDIVSKMLIKDRKNRLSNLEELESVFASVVGSTYSGTGKRKFRLIYAILTVPVFILVIFLYKNYLDRQNEIKVVQSDIDSVSMSLGAVDTLDFNSTAPLVSIKKPMPMYNSKPKEEYADVVLNVSPWADVYIDGASIGTTPFVDALKLKKGKHTIVLKNPYFPILVEDIMITEYCSLTYNLEQRCAFIDITVEPWGIIYIDGELVDTTPIERPIPVLLGDHTIRVRHFQLGERSKRVTMDSTRLYQFSFDLRGE